MVLFSVSWSPLSPSEPPAFCPTVLWDKGESKSDRNPFVSLPGKKGYRAISKHKEGMDSLLSALGTDLNA